MSSCVRSASCKPPWQCCRGYKVACLDIRYGSSILVQAKFRLKIWLVTHKSSTCSAGKRLARYMTPGDQLLKALMSTLAASQQFSACMPVPTRHRAMWPRLNGSYCFCWYTLQQRQMHHGLHSVAQTQWLIPFLLKHSAVTR